MASTSEAMNEFDESMKKQIALILKIVLLNKSLKEDNIPCEIDQVVYLIKLHFVIIFTILLNFVTNDECYLVRVCFWVQLVLLRTRLV